MDVAEKLAALFESRREAIPGLSYQQITDSLNATGKHSTNLMTVYRLHSGKIQRPGIMDVLMLANFYKISLNEINTILGLGENSAQEVQEEKWKKDLKVRLEAFIGQAKEADAILAGQLLEVLTARLRGGEVNNSRVA